MDTDSTTDVDYDGSSDLANISDAQLEALMLANRPKRLAKSTAPEMTPAQVAKDEARSEEAKLMMQQELKSPDGRKLICETGFSGEVLRSMLSRGGGWASKHCISECVAVDYRDDLVKDIADPVERMLLTQILWTHARSGMLSQLAAQQTEVQTTEVMHNLAGRASSLFAKLVNALDRHRQAGRPPAPQTPSGSASASLSITVQQGKKVRNKKGCHATQLPIDAARLAEPAGSHPAVPALADHAGAISAVGQGAGIAEQHETRLVEQGIDFPTTGDPGAAAELEAAAHITPDNQAFPQPI